MVVAGQCLGALLKGVGQPPVIGEVVAGILLGPSLFGRLAPEAFRFVFPPDVISPLGVLAQLGVILYMFVVGLELNTELLRGQLRSTVLISHSSIVVPFALGYGLAVYLHPQFAPEGIRLVHFALFMGIAMSITAFPVLARILSDRGMTRTKLGALALTCAAVDDVTAWCLLALVVGVVRAEGGSILTIVLLTVGFIAFMFLAVRPLFAKLSAPGGRRPSAGAIAITVTAALAAAWTTEAIGIHAIFGAFLLGAVIPHDSALAKWLAPGMGRLVAVCILPAFFAFTGLRTEIGLVSGTYEWLICGVIILVATAGKFGGSYAAARVTGLDQRHALGLGILMNTRGLMELVVLNVGLDLGVISPTLFAMMVLMALATTIATAPVLSRIPGLS